MCTNVGTPYMFSCGKLDPNSGLTTKEESLWVYEAWLKLETEIYNL